MFQTYTGEDPFVNLFAGRRLKRFSIRIWQKGTKVYDRPLPPPAGIFSFTMRIPCAIIHEERENLEAGPVPGFPVTPPGRDQFKEGRHAF